MARTWLTVWICPWAFANLIPLCLSARNAVFLLFCFLGCPQLEEINLFGNPLKTQAPVHLQFTFIFPVACRYLIIIPRKTICWVYLGEVFVYWAFPLDFHGVFFVCLFFLFMQIWLACKQCTASITFFFIFFKNKFCISWSSKVYLHCNFHFFINDFCEHAKFC